MGHRAAHQTKEGKRQTMKRRRPSFPPAHRSPACGVWPDHGARAEDGPRIVGQQPAGNDRARRRKARWE